MKRQRRDPGPAVRVRRSPHLVIYWSRGACVACNYATGTRVRITPFVCEILDACTDWTPPSRVAGAVDEPGDPQFDQLLARLVALDLLQQEGHRVDRRELAMSRLMAWNPEAGFFHASSRDVAFGRGARGGTGVAAARMPPVLKAYRGVPRIPLPRPRRDGEFPRVLQERRTWRRFAPAPVTVDELATLVAFTAGVQHWVDAGGRRLPLKVAPSGGARHAIECYVVCRAVRGLAAGVYHYAPATHELERLRGPVRPPRLRAYLPGSEYFAGASAIVFFTAVLERILWRYPYSRAYRAALVEAGHACQTFCLTATWLGLAPYCVMGLADSIVEQDLGVDGICEPVLYAAGVGRRPSRTAWAPLPRGGRLRIRPNPHLA